VNSPAQAQLEPATREVLAGRRIGFFYFVKIRTRIPPGARRVRHFARLPPKGLRVFYRRVLACLHLSRARLGLTTDVGDVTRPRRPTEGFCRNDPNITSAIAEPTAA
jgi:hypothetical protein